MSERRRPTEEERASLDEAIERLSKMPPLPRRTLLQFLAATNQHYADKPDKFDFIEFLKHPSEQFELKLASKKTVLRCQWLPRDAKRFYMMAVYADICIKLGIDGRTLTYDPNIDLASYSEAARVEIFDHIRLRTEGVFMHAWSYAPTALQQALDEVWHDAEILDMLDEQPDIDLTRLINGRVKAYAARLKEKFRRTVKKRRGPQPTWTKTELRKATRDAVRAIKQENKHRIPTLDAVRKRINAATEATSKHFASGAALGKQLTRRKLSWPELSGRVKV